MTAYILFGLFVLEIAYILFFEGKPKSYRYKQIIRNKAGKKYYRIDYLPRTKLRW